MIELDHMQTWIGREAREQDDSLIFEPHAP